MLCLISYEVFKRKDQMSCHKECFDINSETFKITGSQINLSPRSDKTSLQFWYRNSRPLSAVHSCKNEAKQKTKLTRPRSAGFNLQPPKNKFYQTPVSPSENKIDGKFSLELSKFTDLSSKLLQNLLESSNCKEYFEGRRHCSNSLSQLSHDDHLEGQTNTKFLETDKKNEVLCLPCFNTNLNIQNTYQRSNDLCEKSTHISDSLVQSEFSEASEEKTVRFLEEHLTNHSEENSCHEKHAYFRNQDNCCICLENKHKQNSHENCVHQRWEKSEQAKAFESGLLKNVNFKNKSDFCFSSNNEGKILENKQNFCDFEGKNINKKFSQIEKNENLQYLMEKHVQAENEFGKESESLRPSSKEENHKEALKNTKLNENNSQKLDMTDTTYEEMISLLQTLNEEDSESMNLEAGENATEATPTFKVFPDEKIDYQFAISTYLQELEMEDDSLPENYLNTEKWSSAEVNSPRLEELLKKDSVELAHEVFSLKIQLEDQRRGIKLLKDSLSELKETKKLTELEHQEAINKVTFETEALIQRHQKFIKQLLNEKKNLNETVTKLVQDLKSEEERYKRNIKAIEEKHVVEIKKAKEAQAAADKIKREKWMEDKTKKIKEMTVKGLEPELSRMATRQQEEMTELRNLHKAELEALELRAARRNSELMDELRAELTKEKERAIARETAALRSGLEKEFQSEKNKLQNYIQTLKDRIRKEEEKFSNQELEFQQRLIDYRQEEEKKRQKIIRDHQENLEKLQRQHLIELRKLKESEEAEKELALNNLKKQQAAKFLERETELHQQYKRERDREIELAIETLEKESAQIQSDLNSANEGKLKRLKDKMESEIKDLEASESSLKLKLSEIKSKLSEKEDVIIELNSQIRQLQTELAFFKKSCEEMSLEKAKLKEVIRGEFESSINDLIKEKESLEKEIVSLKEFHLKELTKKDQLNVQSKYEMQKELTRVYSRIKTAVNKKEKIIESLREENEAAHQKCRQLEFMLDQQRRNLLL